MKQFTYLYKYITMEISRKTAGGCTMQYEKLYAEMVGAAEQAVEAIERGNYGQAKDILISAEQRCEAQYLEASETPGGNNTVPST
jgi:hypothetical protein